MNPNPNTKDEDEPQMGQAKKQSGQQQMQTGEGQQYGEGNYKATRQYNEGLKDHVEHHDIEREARDAAPRSASEEREMAEAERVGRSKSRGEGASPDGDAAEPEPGEERDDGEK
jgi:hypothetical protein